MHFAIRCPVRVRFVRTVGVGTIGAIGAVGVGFGNAVRGDAVLVSDGTLGAIGAVGVLGTIGVVGVMGRGGGGGGGAHLLLEVGLAVLGAHVSESFEVHVLMLDCEDGETRGDGAGRQGSEYLGPGFLDIGLDLGAAGPLGGDFGMGVALGGVDHVGVDPTREHDVSGRGGLVREHLELGEGLDMATVTSRTINESENGYLKLSKQREGMVAIGEREESTLTSRI